MAVRTQPTLSSGMSARIAEAAALSPSSFCKRYIPSYETPSQSSSPTLPIRKRYRGTFELILDIETKDESSDSDAEREGHGLEDEGPGLEEEEAALEGQQQAVPVVDTAASEPLGLGYGALRRRELALGEGSVPSALETPPSPEWSSGSLPVSPSSPVVPSPIASPVITPAATISVNEDQFLEVGAQLELHESILHDHTHRLDALPPTLFTGYDQDLRELYTRSGVVRDEIFLQRYRFRSLEREQKRATMTFSAIWRPRENHDLRRRIAKERRERLELTNHVAGMERR
ncbi:hypothetical protein Tco_0471254 [Tanacetum coccineum]